VAAGMVQPPSGGTRRASAPAGEWTGWDSLTRIGK
jgi:hypothetical protein